MEAASRPKPKIQRLPPLPPAEKNHHRERKRIHVICFAIFVILPFFNILRFDVPNQRFYFAGAEIAINEFAIAFFALMFLMFVIAAGAIIYGRIYCSYLCPQMIFSEWSMLVERWAKKRTKYPRLVFHAVLGVASVFLAFVFTAYFVEPRDLFQRLIRFDIVTAGGITGAVVTVLTYLDFTLLRQKFCTAVCPYGYLQGMLQDKNSLLVHYKDNQEAPVCIECKKCVRVCEMGIDIRNSPYQIECVHCGDCIDACEDVMRRIGRPGLIHYSWGEQEQAIKQEPWYMRWGFRDAKRVAILLILLFYAAGLSLALSMRKPVAIQLAPDRTSLYTALPDGRYANKMRVKLANRTSKPSAVRIWTESLPGAEVANLPANPLQLAAGQTIETNFEIRAPRTPQSRDVNRFRVLVQAEGTAGAQSFDMTFIMPVAAKEK